MERKVRGSSSQRTPEDDGFVNPDGTVLLDKTIRRVTSAGFAGGIIGCGVAQTIVGTPGPGCHAASIALGAFIAGAEMARIKIEDSKK